MESAEPSVEASAAGGFTFAQHSPSMDATTEISPIPFIAPSATLLRQGSSTGHVLSTSALADTPNQAAPPSLATKRSSLSLEINSQQTEEAGTAEDGGLLLSPVSAWLGNVEAVRQPHLKFEIVDIDSPGGEAGPSWQADVLEPEEDLQQKYASALEKNLRVRVGARNDSDGPSMERFALYTQEDEAFEDQFLTSPRQQSEVDGAISIAEQSDLTQQESETLVADQGAEYGETEAAAELEGFDSISLTPKEGRGDEPLEGESSEAAASILMINDGIISLAEDDPPMHTDTHEEGLFGEQWTASSRNPIISSGTEADQPAEMSGVDLSNAEDCSTEERTAAVEIKRAARPYSASNVDNISQEEATAGVDDSNGEKVSAAVDQISGEESTAAVEIRKASRPYSASRFREGLPSMRAVKEAGSATVERISTLPKSLGRLVRHSMSGGTSSGAGN